MALLDPDANVCGAEGGCSGGGGKRRRKKTIGFAGSMVMTNCELVSLPGTSNQLVGKLRFTLDCRIQPMWLEGHAMVSWLPETLTLMLVGIVLTPLAITRLFVSLPK